MHWIKLVRGELDRFSMGRLMQFIDLDDGYLRHFCIVTGDGHAHPSFGWIDHVQPLLARHIEDMVKNNVLCAHVEKLDKRVNQKDLPPALYPVHANGKLFGWELGIFEYIEKLMKITLKVVEEEELKRDSTGNNYRSELNEFHKSLAVVLGMAHSINKVPFILHWMSMFDRHSISSLTPDQLRARLINFYNQLMELRTDDDVHRATAHALHLKMKKYNNHSHLFSIGNAHLIRNNICRYIDNTNTGVVVGIADIYTGNADMVF